MREEFGKEFQQTRSVTFAVFCRCVFGILGWMFSAWETRNYLNNAPNKPLHDIYEKVMRQGASIS
jgi:hypothetical protein